jgi:alanine-glyoxylate transaminase/serine-glyoxylate transaminase/serine-pyruvate transaminase
MGPGPSDVNPRILEALSRPTIGHLDPAFVSLMSEVKGLLQFAFQTGNELTMPVSAPGSAGMEACFVNLVSAGDKVIVAQNGVFGGRMKENVERCGAEAVMVQDDWGMPVDPQKVEDALKAHQWNPPAWACNIGIHKTEQYQQQHSGKPKAGVRVRQPLLRFARFPVSA